MQVTKDKEAFIVEIPAGAYCNVALALVNSMRDAQERADYWLSPERTTDYSGTAEYWLEKVEDYKATLIAMDWVI